MSCRDPSSSVPSIRRFDQRGVSNSVLQPAVVFDVPNTISSANGIILLSSRSESSSMRSTNSVGFFFLSPNYLKKYLLPQIRE